MRRHLPWAVLTVLVLLAGCGSGSGGGGGEDAAGAVDTTTSTAGASGPSGIWDVTFEVTSAIDHVTDDTVADDLVQESLERVWEFTAEGCDGGDAGCVVVTDPASDAGQTLPVDVHGDGFRFEIDQQVDSLCGDGLSGHVHATWDFQMTTNRLVGTYEDESTGDDPALCHAATSSYVLSGSPHSSDSTTTSAG